MSERRLSQPFLRPLAMDLSTPRSISGELEAAVVELKSRYQAGFLIWARAHTEYGGPLPDDIDAEVMAALGQNDVGIDTCLERINRALGVLTSLHVRDGALAVDNPPVLH